MEILLHITVHSIPTIGATFSVLDKGNTKRMCIIGDNNGMRSVRDMARLNIVSAGTCDNLTRILSQRYHLLVADGGAFAIHGDPENARNFDSDRVVIVHVEHLAHQFTTTFSLASSGKRYIVVDGDSTIYSSLMNQYLSIWLGEPFSQRWARTIMAQQEVRRCNKGDVIMVQEELSRGYVYLILTGYCDVVVFDGEDFQTIVSLQAGEIICEMAVVTGSMKRNASVVASSPVSVMVLSEEKFNELVQREGYRDRLIKRGGLRTSLRRLPQFWALISTALEKVSGRADEVVVAPGDEYFMDEDSWFIFIDGSGHLADDVADVDDEFGYRPFSSANTGVLKAETECRLARFQQARFASLLSGTPQRNYLLRKFRVDRNDPAVDWLLGGVTIS